MARTVPDRSSPTRLRGWVAATVTLAVVGRTFLGSARALADIGRRARVSDPWALPIGLDGMAVVAAIARHHRRDDRWAQVALIVGVAVSTGLQVAAAPAGLANQITHAVPPVAAWLTFELFLRATDHVTVRNAESPSREGQGSQTDGALVLRAPTITPPTEAEAPGAGRIGPPTSVVEGGSPLPDRDAEVEAPAAMVERRRATLDDARQIDAGRRLKGRELERAILADGLAVTRRRATQWATEMAAPPAPPDGAPRHLEAVAR